MTGALVSGSHVRVRLAKSIHTDVEYDAMVISDNGTHIVVRGLWAEEEARCRCSMRQRAFLDIPDPG